MIESVRRRWEPLCAAALLLLALLLAFSDVLAPGRGLMYRDHLLHHRWVYSAIRQALLDGRLPGLELGGTAGVPVEHLLNGTYTPGTLLLLLGSFDQVYDLFVLAHFLILGTGTLALARSLGASAPAALVAAALAAVAGPSLSTENLVVALQGLSYCPWLLWALARLVRTPSWPWIAPLALAIGFQSQALLPEVLVLDLAGAVALGLHLRPRPSVRLLKMLGAALALGLALGALGYAPALESLAGTRRGAGFSYEARSGWCLSPLGLIEVLAPAFWSPPDQPYINVGAATGQSQDPAYFTTLYLGTGLPLLACSGRGRAGRALLVALTFFTLLAFGRYTPLHPWLSSWPLLRNTRYAIKYLWPAMAAAAALAALAVGELPELKRRLVVTAGLHLALLVGLLSLLDFPEFHDFVAMELDKGWGYQPTFAGIERAQYPDLALAAMRGRLLFACLPAGLLVALAVVAAARPELAKHLPWAVAALLCLDLGYAGRWAIFGVDLQAQQPPPGAQRELEGLDHRYFSEATMVAERSVAAPVGVTPLEAMLRSYGQRARSFLPGARRYFDLDINAHSEPFHARVYELVERSRGPGVLAVLERAGVDRLLSARAHPELSAPFTYSIPGEAAEHIYRLPAPAPYLRAYGRFTRIDPQRFDDNALMERLSALPPELGLLVGPGEVVSTSSTCGAPRLEQVRSEPLRSAEALVHADCEALVVLAEPRMMGWSAEIDGNPAPLLTADLGYLGVRAPPGAHRVRFEYRPLHRRWLYLSAAAWALIVALGLLGRARCAGARGQS